MIFNISLLKLYYADFQRIRFWTPSESIELVLKEKIIKAEKGTRISFFFFAELKNYQVQKIRRKFRTLGVDEYFQ